ncbi:MAG: hypothetical protein LV481_11520 [Methylacidiphilales bacterium]|nr:hypothetical protein [Candidatus Methylacidiphilales bacterium]
MDKPEATIPEDAYSAIQALVELGTKDFDALVDALSKAKPAIDPSDFCKHLSEQSPQIKFSVIASILDELFRMEVARESWNLPVPEFAKHLADAALEEASEEFPITPESRDVLEARLSRIFESRKALSLTAKALSIVTDQPHLFYSAKLLSDIRPVFNESGKSIDAMVILHNLRIHYGDGEEHKDFVVTLDRRDIKKLRSVLERAEQKAETLRAFLKLSQTEYLDVED